MDNEQILLDKWRTLSSDKQLEVLDFMASIEERKTSGVNSYQPKTELGKKLWLLRERAIASGKIELLDWDGIAIEVAQRRGESD